MKAKTLVQAWLVVELDMNGKTLADALRDLNRALGSAHTHSRIREWEKVRNGRGDRLPRRVRVYMGRVVIRAVLADAGINVSRLSSATLNKLVDRLC